MKPARILLVEDDVLLRRTLSRSLTREGFTVVEAGDGEEAEARLNEHDDIELILSDLEMPRAGGREVLKMGNRRQIPVVILTGTASVPVAVEMMREGAANFLTKPYKTDELREVLDQAFAERQKKRPEVSADVVGSSTGFRRVIDQVSSFADSDAPVLITGESGTGKEVVARLIHSASNRSAKPFVAVNCGALPEALLESELFGHARGAFTGATHARIGRFQLAEGGTLFLDEVGDMPLAFQVKLLRVLQERQYEPLGDSVTRKTDVRVIAATHRDVPRLLDEGAFREDLYYRLCVFNLHLPALRERREDIPLLVEHLIGAANARHGRTVTGASPELLAALAAQPWPGNIRELSNMIERMVVVRRQGELTLADLGETTTRPPARTADDAKPTLPPEGIDLREAIAHLEYSLIDQALERTGQNKNAAAQLLGLNRTTLVEKLKRRQ